jgi:hypothetical protein
MRLHSDEHGAWRSLVSAPVWGTGGPEFKSRRPDETKAPRSRGFRFPGGIDGSVPLLYQNALVSCLLNGPNEVDLVERFVPAAYLAAAKEKAKADIRLIPSPLPDIAATFYSAGG